MAKTKQKELIFTVGVNLADGRRFEKGEQVPADVSEKELKVLRELGAIGESE